MANLERVRVMAEMVAELATRLAAELKDGNLMNKWEGAMPLEEEVEERLPTIEDLRAIRAGQGPGPVNETPPPFAPRPDLNVPFAGGGRSPGGRPWSTNPEEGA